MRFNVRFVLLYVMPAIALVGTLWIIASEPALEESWAIHHARLFSAKVLIVAAWAAASYLTPRGDK